MNAFRPSLLALVAGISAALLSACGSDSGTSPVAALPSAGGTLASAAATPTFLPPDPTAPAIANPTITFWAKRGVDATVLMYYAPRPGQTDSTVFLRFRVRKKSLAFYPNGTAFANGDSVQITISFVDAATRTVEFQPAGLRFSLGDPASLKLSYLEADDDYNQDGVVNSADTQLSRSFKIWKLHPPNPWQPQTSKVSLSLHEVESSVFDFTSYAIAY